MPHNEYYVKSRKRHKTSSFAAALRALFPTPPNSSSLADGPLLILHALIDKQYLISIRQNDKKK